MSIIIPANSAVGGGFDVANSCVFNPGAKMYHEYGSATNRRTFTISLWIKKCSTTTEQNFVFAGNLSGSNPYMDARFNSDQTINWYCSASNGSLAFNLITTRKFTDPNAWYHMVLAVDTTQGTSSNRVRLYTNGVEETSLSTKTYPSQNFETPVNDNNYEIQYGAVRNNTPNYNGYMSEIVEIDGQQLDPTSFGEFDEDSGIWKPISVSGLTFGDNGHYLQFQNSAALGDDTSGNNNDFTLTNIAATDQSADTCTNNFCVSNLLDKSSSLTLSEGNLKCTSPNDSTFRAGRATFGITTGKWFWEVKASLVSGGDARAYVGISTSGYTNLNSYLGANAFGWGYYSNDGNKSNSGSSSSYGNSWSTNDIIGVAFDATNGTLIFYKNGTSQGTAFTGLTGETYFPTVTNYCQGGSGASVIYNFGSPPYSISSGNADGDGYGNFEYAVPSGYFSLNTKNLAEYG